MHYSRRLSYFTWRPQGHRQKKVKRDTGLTLKYRENTPCGVWLLSVPCLWMRNDEYADKRLAYQASLFPAVAKILADYPVWGLDLAVVRKGLEIEKIINYIFEKVE